MTASPTVHEQLAELMARKIDAGEWEAGGRFPSEREIADTYAISRATANKVLAKLVSEGWLEMRKGQGSFIAERPTLFASLRRLESFTSYATAQGFHATTRVLHFQRGAGNAPAHVLANLGIGKREKVIFFRRVRLADEVPVICEERWLPAQRYPGLTVKAIGGSFYSLCRERYGLQVQREEAEIRATLLPDELAAAGQIAWDVPCLQVDGTGFDGENRPLWVQRLYCHGGRFALVNQAGSARAFPGFSLNLSQTTHS